MKRNLVAESIEDFYGPGYTSDSTALKPKSQKTDYDKNIQNTIVDDIFINVIDTKEVSDLKIDADLNNFIYKYISDYAKISDDPEIEKYIEDHGAHILLAIRTKIANSREEFSESSKKSKFKRGEKQWQVLDFIDSKGKEGATYTEIIKAAYELSYGEGSFDPRADRGYWSEPFRSPAGTDGYPWQDPNYKGGWITRLTDKVGKKYFLNDAGLTKLRELTKQFG